MTYKQSQRARPCGPRCERIEQSPGCIQATLGIIGDKWSPFLIARLIDQPLTFSELHELLPGISPRTLSARLRRLEIDGIVVREQYMDRPQRFRYHLTKKGEELTDLLTLMAAWGKKYCL